jgi:dihydropteroate synthase
MYWKCKDYNIEYGAKTLIMGIVNVTPDSFSDGGEHFDADNAAEYALTLAAHGADIIDIGAQSTRPGSEKISADEEWSRLEPVLKALNGRCPVPVSVDTFYPQVAAKAAENGAVIINDVSGGVSPEMAEVVRNTGCGWIIMHFGEGTCGEVVKFFEESAEKCASLGIDPSQLCFDMGIGFGKDYECNMALLANTGRLKLDGYPLLLGTSRKRVIGAASGQSEPKERIYGNIAADTLAVLGGIDIIRLHDVKNERQGILTAEKLKEFIVE